MGRAARDLEEGEVIELPRKDLIVLGQWASMEWRHGVETNCQFKRETVSCRAPIKEGDPIVLSGEEGMWLEQSVRGLDV